MTSKSQAKRLAIQGADLEKLKKREQEVAETLAQAKRELREDQLLVIQIVSLGMTGLSLELVTTYNDQVAWVDKLQKEFCRVHDKVMKEWKL